MKPWTVLLLLLMATPALAQTELMTDPASDVSKTIAGVDAPLPLYNIADLRGLTLEETKDQFHFDLAIETTSTTGFFLEQANYFVDFVHEDQPYQVQVSVSPTGAASSEVFARGFLRFYDEAFETYRTARSMNVNVDGTMLSWSLEREWLLDKNGAEPFPGRALSDFKVTSQAGIELQVDQAPTYFGDIMPNDDVLPSWDIQFGLQQTGHLSLKAPVPTRASNGEATTFVFDAFLGSQTGEEELVALAAEQVPEDWTVTLPSEEVLLPFNETLRLPIVVSVPFKHVHGLLESFILTGTSMDGTSVARVELGVRYLEIPQPAGHHNTVYLHAVEGFGNEFNMVLDTARGTNSRFYGVMNTEEDYELAQPEELSGGGGFGENAPVFWSFPLSPALEMGLDFDMAGTGELRIPFSSPIALSDATAEATLRVRTCQFQCEFVDLVSFTSEPFDVSGQPTEVVFQLELLPDADLVPYSPQGTSLELVVQLNRNMPGTSELTPSIHPGGFMVLPLNEYHDPVEAIPSLSGLDLIAAGPIDRPVNPAETVLFNFSLTNTGLVKETFHLEVQGPNEWARPLGATGVSVGPGESRRVVVAVEVPDGTPDGVVADYVLRASSSKDVSLQALVPFRANVDAVIDHPDESQLLLETEEELSEETIPALPLLAVVLGLVLACNRKLQ